MIFEAPEWMPDKTSDVLETTTDLILNVTPDTDGYRPWPNDEVVTSTCGADTVRGAIGVLDSARLSYDYAGDKNNLFRLVSTSWTRATNVTLSATYSYSLSNDQWWEFEQWNNTVIATNGINPVQEITLGATNFTDLAGDPPVAYHAAVVKDFLMLGNISGFPQRVQWCAINNTHAWTVDATTQADFQDLIGDGGHVQKIIGGNIATVFQENAIWRAQYVGSPAIFDFGNGPVVKNVGLYAPQSAAAHGSRIFFLAKSGFYALESGALNPIGYGKIDNTFFADLDVSNVHRIHAVIHPEKKLYIVAYPGANNIAGHPNRILVYNFEIGRWSVVYQNLEMLFNFVSTGYTLEGLDAFGTLDSLPASLDSSLWNGGQKNLAMFDLPSVLRSFTGTAKDAIVTTSEFAPLPGKRAKVTRVRPLVDDNAATIRPLTRNRLSEERAIGTEVSQLSSGDCPIRVNAHYISFQVRTSGDFNRIRGAEVLEFEDAGDR